MKRKLMKAALFAGVAVAVLAEPFHVKPAHACTSTPFIAGMCVFAGNFAPRSWAFTHGQLLPINTNTALFALVGTTYGGDGRTTFALPDTRGRAVIGAGLGPGLSNYRLGQRGGVERVTLSVAQMPSHNHTATLQGQSAPGNQEGPGGTVLARDARDRGYSTAAPDVTMSSASIAVGNAGGSQSHENRPPFIALNWIIALQGLFPSRN